MMVDTTHLTSTADASFAGNDPDPRHAILDAAALAFMRKGYAATSIDDVADILNATKGKVYHHYRKKADLFFDVHKRCMEMDLTAVQTAASLPHRTSIDRLRAMTLRHLALIMHHLPYQRVAAQGLEMHLTSETTTMQRAVLSDILLLRDQYENLFRDAIRQIMEEGHIPQQNLQIIVKTFFGVLNWTAIWLPPDDTRSEADKLGIADAIAAFAMRGLGAP